MRKTTVRSEPSPALLASMRAAARREQLDHYLRVLVYVYLIVGASAGLAALLVLLVTS